MPLPFKQKIEVKEKPETQKYTITYNNKELENLIYERRLGAREWTDGSLFERLIVTTDVDQW